MEPSGLVLVPAAPSDDHSAGSRSQTPSKHYKESSETAIVSIYSMYSDDGTSNSWTPPQSRRDKRRTMTHAQSEYYRKSLSKASFDTELPYYTEKTPKSRGIDLQKAVLTKNDPYDNSVQRRPSSSYAPPSSSSLGSMEHRRAASAGRNEPFQPSRSVPNVSRSREPSPRRPSSRSNSIHHKSDSSDREYPPLPPSIPATRTPTPTSRQRTPPPQRTPDRLTVPDGTPSTSSSMPLKHPPYVSSMSKTSLVPSEGEDLDGFHVRNTYAQLEMSGVKGDGFVEGVERTRARIGDSRASQLQAESAIGDGSEKSQELEYEQVQVLNSVDRYGFFASPSHDRLVLLPRQPLLKRLSPIGLGPPNAHPSPPQLQSLPPTNLPPKELSRIGKWTRMLLPDRRDVGGNVESWFVKPSKEAKLRSRTYKGVPDRWRAAGWEVMMARFSKLSHSEMVQLGRDYRDGLERPSTYDIQIDLDVPRTISGHIMFRTRYGQGQRSLFHVLHSFSLRCPTCGYVQGMGPIAATLLCYFEPERVYASLVRLHDAYSLHTIFSPGFPGLLESIYVQERVTETMMPEVYKAFKRNMISTTSYATKWYITLFSNSVPFQTQLRMWDAFLLEGPDVFVAVAVAIVWVYRDHITSTSANFETVLSLLSSFFVPEDEDVLMQWMEQALGNQTLRSYMEKWRADWQNLVKDGKEGTALL